MILFSNVIVIVGNVIRFLWGRFRSPSQYSNGEICGVGKYKAIYPEEYFVNPYFQRKSSTLSSNDPLRYGGTRNCCRFS